MPDYTFNPDLKQIDLPFEWEGTPLDDNGRFINHEHPFVDSFKELLKWQTMRNPQKEEKKNDTWRLKVISDTSFLINSEDCIIWLGHASFYIRLAGISFLIDPVIYNVSLLKRRAAFPFPVDSFKNIDYVLISHDHRDHCDEKSLKQIARNNPGVNYLTGLAVGKVIKKFTKSALIQEAGWYQQFKTSEKIELIYVPSRHWGRRYLRDTNVRLWGGFIIRGNGKTIYFSGDSGKGNHFKEISQVFPGIDYCIMGIGAYKPEFFMAQSHISPRDAFTAFLVMGANYMIPMHYGTFDLSDEPLGDPIRVLKKQADHHNQGKSVKCLDVGEVLYFS